MTADDSGSHKPEIPASFLDSLARSMKAVFRILNVQDERVLYVSPTCESILGPSPESLRENPRAFLETVHPEDRDRVEEALPRRTTGDYEVEYRIPQPDGTTRWIHDRSYPVRDRTGRVGRVVVLAEDITEQRETKQKLQNRVHEKETRLQEVHHRVKNSLQVILGLLDLQSRRLEGPEAVRALHNSQRRIQSMALIHRKLHEKAHGDRIDFAEYVDELVEEILASRADSQRDVRIETDVRSGDLDGDTATACGLIVNELVTNALQHAFTPGETGTVTVEFFTDEAGNHHLIVADNGEGVDPADMTGEGSLGRELVDKVSVNQLQGSIDYVRDDGLHVEVVFPPESAR